MDVFAAPMTTARIPLPDPAIAPGVRDFMRVASEFTLREMIPGWGLLAPGEGAGATRNYLRRIAFATRTRQSAT